MEEKESRKESEKNFSTNPKPIYSVRSKNPRKTRENGEIPDDRYFNSREKKKSKENTLLPLLPPLPRLSANARTPVKRVIYNFLKRQFVIGILRKVQRHYKFTFTNRWNGSGLPLWGREGNRGRIGNKRGTLHFATLPKPLIRYFTLPFTAGSHDPLPPLLVIYNNRYRERFAIRISRTRQTLPLIYIPGVVVARI